MDGPTIKTLQRLKHRTVIEDKQALRHMKTVVGIDADQVGIERGVMDFRERDAVWNHRLTKLLVLVGNYVLTLSRWVM